MAPKEIQEKFKGLKFLPKAKSKAKVWWTVPQTVYGSRITGGIKVVKRLPRVTSAKGRSR